MTTPHKTPREVVPDTGAGIAGIGGGTGLVAIANALPDKDPLKPWLLLLAPTITVGLAVFWLFIRVAVENVIEDLRIKNVARGLREYVRAALADPNCTEQHRQMLQTQLRKLDLIVTTRSLRRLELLEPVTEADLERISASALRPSAGSE